MNQQCPVCRGEIQPTVGPGRPARYCSIACRRAAEFEIRRLDKLIGSHETRLSKIRTGVFALDGAEDRLADEIDRLNLRLRQLLVEDGA